MARIPARTKSASAPEPGQPPIDLDLKGRHRGEPIAEHEQRFHIFLIDSGWNTAVSKAARGHLHLLAEFTHRESLYVLTPEMSVELLRQVPELIGHDPILLVYDLYVPPDRRANYRGFRLNLGLMRHAEQAMARLQEFVRFVTQHRSATELERAVNYEMHRGGFDGMIKILREEFEASIELL